MIVGVIVGSGIFVSPKGVLLYAHSWGSALLVWISCGILTTLGALCYAELGTSIPKSGGDYAYIMEAFGPLPAFLYLWGAVTIIMPAMNAIGALTMANYILYNFFPGCEAPENATRFIAALAVCELYHFLYFGTLSSLIVWITSLSVSPTSVILHQEEREDSLFRSFRLCSNPNFLFPFSSLLLHFSSQNRFD